MEQEKEQFKQLAKFIREKLVSGTENYIIDNNLLERPLKRWIISKSPKKNDGVAEVVNDYRLLNKLLEEFFIKIETLEFKKNPVPIIVLMRLFMVKELSDTFIDNFKENFDKVVYNSKIYFYNEFPDGKITLLKEIIRLFTKSSNQHYYSIRPKYHETKNYLTESFSKSKILHTLLSVEFTFRRIFLTTDWDTALIISETGSILNFLEYYSDKKRFNNKKIIVLNSYEAIRQINTDRLSSSLINEKSHIRKVNLKQRDRYNGYLFNGTNPTKNIFTFSLPSLQHNHHIMLFIKSVDTDKDRETVPLYITNSLDSTGIFEMTGALYIYRQGYSTSLNPIMVGIHPFKGIDDDLKSLNHDFKKLLRIFVTTLYKALAFQGIEKLKDLEIIFTGYQSWSPDEEFDNFKALLNYMHDPDRMKFMIDKNVSG